MNIHLRNISPDDFELIYQITKAAMHKYVEETFGHWVDSYQRSLINEKINMETYKVIQSNHADIGLMVVENEKDCIRLASLYLLPAVQNKGMGTKLLHELQMKAAKENLPVKLRVLACNPARFWYIREGFQIIEQTQERWFMEWQPPFRLPN